MAVFEAKTTAAKHQTVANHQLRRGSVNSHVQETVFHRKPQCRRPPTQSRCYTTDAPLTRRPLAISPKLTRQRSLRRTSFSTKTHHIGAVASDDVASSSVILARRTVRIATPCRYRAPVTPPLLAESHWERRVQTAGADGGGGADDGRRKRVQKTGDDSGRGRRE